MEKAAGRAIPVRMAGRREGDVGFCVADTGRAERELGWRTGMSLDECARDTWRCIRGC
jgi:UDP-glucose 4-epimerase